MEMSAVLGVVWQLAPHFPNAAPLPPLANCRVLIFLEAEALSQPAPSFGVHFIPPLLEAAQKLGLRSLEVGVLG